MVIETSYLGCNIAIAGTRILHVLTHLEAQVRVIINRDLDGDSAEFELEALETWGVLEFLSRRGITITIR